MALNSYLRLTGETQGEIKGGCDIATHEDSLEVIGWSHEVISPRDAASGLPTGKRQHKPYVVTKEIDKASPLLANVIVGNENITDWKLELWRTNSAGAEEHYYTIELVNANIAGIRSESLNNKYPDNMAHMAREHASFTYQKITWTYEDGGITGYDDWKTPKT